MPPRYEDCPCCGHDPIEMVHVTNRQMFHRVDCTLCTPDKVTYYSSLAEAALAWRIQVIERKAKDAFVPFKY
jgi:transcription elongation factor Elf1